MTLLAFALAAAYRPKRPMYGKYIKVHWLALAAFYAALILFLAEVLAG